MEGVGRGEGGGGGGVGLALFYNNEYEIKILYSSNIIIDVELYNTFYNGHAMLKSSTPVTN